MLEVDNSRRMTPEIVGSEKHASVLKYVASAGLSGAVQISTLGLFLVATMLRFDYIHEPISSN